jgi:protein-L-isoaspartate(D-aspartate) O-methyltransferase
MTPNDTYKHKGLRQKLVEGLRDKGITDQEVLSAINSVPRHLFLDSSFLEFAYQDKAFPIGAGQTISQPFTVAVQTSLLDVKEGQKVLEIGTGSGYQASILVEMGARVFSVERQRELYQKTKKKLDALGYTARLFYGDGYKGLPSFAPFDRILITAAAPEIPDALVGQLRPGGRLVVPLNEGKDQVMTVLDLDNERNPTITKHGRFRFVPMLKAKR